MFIDARVPIAELLESSGHGDQREIRRIAVLDFIPRQWRRDARIWLRAHRVRGGNRTIFSVLVVIDEHSLALFLPPLTRGECRRTLLDFPGQCESREAYFIEAPVGLDAHIDVHATRARRFGPADQFEIVEHRPDDRGDLLDLFPGHARHGVQVDAQLVGMIEILGADRMRMKLEASQICEPGQRRRITRYHLLRSTARWEVQLDHFDPRRPAVGRALLIEVIALDAVGVAHQHVGPTTGTAQRSFANGDVVADEVEFGELRFREQNLVGVRDCNLVPGNCDNLCTGALFHDIGLA